MRISAKMRSKSTSIGCASGLTGPGPASRPSAALDTCLTSKVPIKPAAPDPGLDDRHALGWFERLVPQDSLARRLVRRLLPALFILIAIDMLATWFMTGMIRPQPWL